MLQMGLLWWKWDDFNRWSLNARSTNCFELSNFCDFCCSDEHCRSSATLTKTHSQLAVDLAPLLNGTGREDVSGYLRRPKTTWKLSSHTADKKKVRGIYEKSSRPQYNYARGSMTISIENALLRAMGKNNISGPSPVLWLFRVPLVTSCVLPLDCPAHPATWTHAVRGAAATPRIQHWKLHGSIFCQSLINLHQVDSRVFQLQSYSGTQEFVSLSVSLSILLFNSPSQYPSGKSYNVICSLN